MPTFQFKGFFPFITPSNNDLGLLSDPFVGHAPIQFMSRLRAFPVMWFRLNGLHPIAVTRLGLDLLIYKRQGRTSRWTVANVWASKC